MVAADRVVEQLRARSGRTPGPAAVSAPASPPGALPAFPRPAATPAPVRTPVLPAASVPVVLLSLGCLCLLVAAAVFVAVAWSALGLTGRTLVLLGVTALLVVRGGRAHAQGPARSRRDVLAGRRRACSPSTCWAPGRPGWPGSTPWTGAARGPWSGWRLLVLGLAVGVWAHGQPVGRLYGAEAVAAAGAALVCATNVWLAENPAVACTIAVPLLALLFVPLRSLLPVTAYAVGALGLVSWLVLLLRRLGPGPRTRGPRRLVVRPARLAAAGRGRSSPLPPPTCRPSPDACVR